MMLDRLGRLTLHAQRYAEPRAISRFEGDSHSQDAAFQVVDSVEPTSADPLRRETPAVPARGSTHAPAAGKGDVIRNESGAAPFADIETPSPEMSARAAETPGLPMTTAPAENVESVLEREFHETRTEFVTVHEVMTPVPDQSEEVDGTADVDLPDTGVLSREFEAVESRLSRLEAEQATGVPDPTRQSPPIAVAPAPLAIPIPVSPRSKEHHVEVLIDSIVVNAVPPDKTAASKSPRRDPAHGLAHFQQSRRR